MMADFTLKKKKPASGLKAGNQEVPGQDLYQSTSAMQVQLYQWKSLLKEDSMVNSQFTQSTVGDDNSLRNI